MMIVTWLLSVQFWPVAPPVIQIHHTKEFSTYNECMIAREQIKDKQFQVLCLMKVNNVR